MPRDLWPAVEYSRVRKELAEAHAATDRAERAAAHYLAALRLARRFALAARHKSPQNQPLWWTLTALEDGIARTSRRRPQEVQ